MHQDQPAFSFQTADFVHVSEKSEQGLLLLLLVFFIVSRSVPPKKKKNLSVFSLRIFYSEHLAIWHSSGVVLLLRPSDYDVFPVGCSLNSESSLAAQTAVGVTEVESLPCINQKPAPRRDVSGLWLWRIIRLWLTHAFGTQISSLVTPLYRAPESITFRHTARALWESSMLKAF